MGRILRLDTSIVPELQGLNIGLRAGGLITVSGRQFKSEEFIPAVIPTLVPNDRYQIYSVLSGGAPTLIIDQAENSVGPVGFSSHKLVGSFRADLLGNFNKFLGINGESREFEMTVEDASPVLSPPISNGIFSSINRSNILSDSDGNYTVSNGRYTVPEDSYVDVTQALWLTGTFANNGRTELYIALNSFSIRGNYWVNSSNGGSNQSSLQSVSSIFTTKGTTIETLVRPNNWTTVSLVNNSDFIWFSVSGRNANKTPLKDL